METSSPDGAQTTRLGNTVSGSASIYSERTVSQSRRSARSETRLRRLWRVFPIHVNRMAITEQAPHR